LVVDVITRRGAVAREDTHVVTLTDTSDGPRGVKPRGAGVREVMLRRFPHPLFS